MKETGVLAAFDEIAGEKAASSTDVTALVREFVDVETTDR